MYTQSSIAAYQRCPRYYRHRYVNLRVPVGRRDAALSLGSAVHACLERWWRGEPWEPGIADTDESTRGIARAMMLGYDARWSDTRSHFDVIDVEREFRVTIDAVDFAGKYDAVMRDNMGRLWLVEHKTSSEDVSPGSAYWRSLELDLQISLYLRSMIDVYGERPAGVIYDVLRKPSVRRRKAESTDSYVSRAIEAIADDPEKHYVRGAVVRTGDPDAWITDLLDAVASIDFSVGLGIWPRAPGACRKWNRLCGYFDVCAGVARLDDSRLFEPTELHPELTLGGAS